MGQPAARQGRSHRGDRHPPDPAARADLAGRRCRTRSAASSTAALSTDVKIDGHAGGHASTARRPTRRRTSRIGGTFVNPPTQPRHDHHGQRDGHDQRQAGRARRRYRARPATTRSTLPVGTVVAVGTVLDRWLSWTPTSSAAGGRSRWSQAATGGSACVEGEDEIEEAIQILSSAPARASASMRPEFGCGIYDLVFEPNTAQLHGRVQARVARRWSAGSRASTCSTCASSRRRSRSNLLLIRIDYRVRSNNALLQPRVSLLPATKACSDRSLAMPLEAEGARRSTGRSRRSTASCASRIPRYTPEWTDFNDSDPGITLLQLFALADRDDAVPDERRPAQELPQVRAAPRPAARRAEGGDGTARVHAEDDREAGDDHGRVRASAPRRPARPVVFETTQDLDVIAAPLAHVVVVGDGGITPVDRTRPDPFYPFGRNPAIGNALHLGFKPVPGNLTPFPRKMRVPRAASGSGHRRRAAAGRRAAARPRAAGRPGVGVPAAPHPGRVGAPQHVRRRDGRLHPRRLRGRRGSAGHRGRRRPAAAGADSAAALLAAGADRREPLSGRAGAAPRALPAQRRRRPAPADRGRADPGRERRQRRPALPVPGPAARTGVPGDRDPRRRGPGHRVDPLRRLLRLGQGRSRLRGRRRRARRSPSGTASTGGSRRPATPSSPRRGATAAARSANQVEAGAREDARHAGRRHREGDQPAAGSRRRRRGGPRPRSSSEPPAELRKAGARRHRAATSTSFAARHRRRGQGARARRPPSRPSRAWRCRARSRCCVVADHRRAAAAPVGRARSGRCARRLDQVRLITTEVYVAAPAFIEVRLEARLLADPRTRRSTRWRRRRGDRSTTYLSPRQRDFGENVSPAAIYAQLFGERAPASGAVGRGPARLRRRPAARHSAGRSTSPPDAIVYPGAHVIVVRPDEDRFGS